MLERAQQRNQQTLQAHLQEFAEEGHWAEGGVEKTLSTGRTQERRVVLTNLMCFLCCVFGCKPTIKQSIGVV